MISLASIDQAVGSNFAAAQTSVADCDERVSRVLDCAEFYRWKEEQDGTRTAYFTLRKGIPGAPAGSVLSLRQLHDLLFPKGGVR